MRTVTEYKKAFINLVKDYNRKFANLMMQLDDDSNALLNKNDLMGYQYMYLYNHIYDCASDLWTIQDGLNRGDYWNE